MQIQGGFKDNIKTKTEIFKELQINICNSCVNTQEAQETENETILGM